MYMDWLENLRAMDALRSAGFSRRQIHQLKRLRRKYCRKNQREQSQLDLAHLQFARWLVMRGKLTEQLPQ